MVSTRQDVAVTLKDACLKTEICSFFKRGRCLRGESCRFAHDIRDLHEKPDLKRTHLCWGFRRGACALGDSCKYAHGTASLRAPVVGASTRPQTVQRAAPRVKVRELRRPLSIAPATFGDVDFVETADGVDPSFQAYTQQHREAYSLRAACMKTEMCKFFQSGLCHRGEFCRFAHDVRELHEKPDLTHTHLCWRFEHGSCNLGDSCNYAHGTASFGAPEFYSAPAASTCPRTIHSPAFQTQATAREPTKPRINTYFPDYEAGDVREFRSRASSAAWPPQEQRMPVDARFPAEQDEQIALGDMPSTCWSRASSAAWPPQEQRMLVDARFPTEQDEQIALGDMPSSCWTQPYTEFIHL